MSVGLKLVSCFKMSSLEITKNPYTKSQKKKSNKIQQCIKILFHIYMKFNMFRATHLPSSGA